MHTLDNILRLLKERGKKQKDLMEYLDISKNVFTDWKGGRNSSYLKHLPRIATFLGVSVDTLLGNGVSDTKIPVRGLVAAGLPIEAVEDILDYEEITADMAAKGEYMALKLRGESMEPRMKNGDVVIVRIQPEVENGDVAVVLVGGAEATVKKVRISADGIMLVPYNPSYEPVYFSKKEIEELPVTIIGKVVELRAKF